MPRRRAFIKQASFGMMGIGLFTLIPGCQQKKNVVMSDLTLLPRSTPEQQGISSEGIINLLKAIKESNIGFHSLMVIRNGNVVAEGWWNPYQAEYIHTLYSLSKSFTSTAVGMAVDEKLLTVEDDVISFFPNDLPENINDNLRAMKVKHLLTMSTGHDQGTMDAMRADESGNWVRAFLAQPVPKEPGTFFFYNTGATYMLSAIIQKLTGSKLIDFLSSRLFKPLQIEEADWEEDPRGINVGGYGLRIKTEDIAKLGLLYLQNGVWNGQQLIPKEWVSSATSKQIQSNPANPAGSESDWAQGYGYQFWRNYPGGFRADGAFGQFSIVFPDLNIVIAATSESFDMQGSMRLLWEHLLPAISKSDPLPENTEMHNKLVDELNFLKMEPTTGNNSSLLIEKINNQSFELDENELGAKSVSFDFQENEMVFTVVDGSGTHKVKCGTNDWNSENDRTDLLLDPFNGRNRVQSKIAAFATWESEKMLILTLKYIETAHGDRLTFLFNNDEITINFMNSVAQNRPNEPDARKEVTGRIIEISSM